MLITSASLEALRVGFKTHFQSGFAGVPSMRDRVSTRVDSADMEERYGWIGELPEVREWIGPRVVHSLKEHDYAIREKAWELTLAVPRRNIETDKLGTFAARFQILHKVFHDFGARVNVPAARISDRVCSKYKFVF